MYYYYYETETETNRQRHRDNLLLLERQTYRDRDAQRDRDRQRRGDKLLLLLVVVLLDRQRNRERQRMCYYLTIISTVAHLTRAARMTQHDPARADETGSSCIHTKQTPMVLHTRLTPSSAAALISLAFPSINHRWSNLQQLPHRLREAACTSLTAIWIISQRA